MAEVVDLPHFQEALARQGVELHELQESPGGLGCDRRAALLGAVLQERHTLVELPSCPNSPGSPVSSRRFKQRVEEQFCNVLERQRDKEQRRSLVAQRQAEIFQEQKGLQEEKAACNQEREKRVQARNQKEENARQETARKRAASKNATKERAEAHTTKFIERRQAHLEEKEERLAQQLERLDEEKESQRKELLKRFELVKEGGEKAREMAESTALAHARKAEEKAERSEQAQEAWRYAYEVKQQEKRDRITEREHQALRITRMHEYMRHQRWIEVDMDMATFEDAMQLKKAIEMTCCRIATGQVTAGALMLEAGESLQGTTPQASAQEASPVSTAEARKEV